MSQADLSIIIVSFNVKAYLLKCLNSIFKQSGKSLFEVIVVDNASIDASAEAVKNEFPQVVLVANLQNKGFAKANNQGIKITCGRNILLLNPDTKIIDNSLEKMANYLDQNKNIGICGPILLNPDRSVQNMGYMFPTLFSLFNSKLIKTKSRNPYEVDWVQGAGLMFKSSLLKTVGYFDEKYFMYGEEKDFCFRVKKEGWKVVVLPSCSLIHYSSQSTKGREASAFVEYHRSQAYFLRKHYSRWFSFMARWFFYLGALKNHVIASFFTGDKWRQKRAVFSSVLKWYSNS
ncbi:MAG: glycosyltransferase family 2 protein [bacterium]